MRSSLTACTSRTVITCQRRWHAERRIWRRAAMPAGQLTDEHRTPDGAADAPNVR